MILIPPRIPLAIICVMIIVAPSEQPFVRKIDHGRCRRRSEAEPIRIGDVPGREVKLNGFVFCEASNRIAPRTSQSRFRWFA